MSSIRFYKKERIDLTKKENWTPDLIYVHRSRLIAGFLIGLVIGIFLCLG